MSRCCVVHTGIGARHAQPDLSKRIDRSHAGRRVLIRPRCSAVSRVPFGGFAALDTASAPRTDQLLSTAFQYDGFRATALARPARFSVSGIGMAAGSKNRIVPGLVDLPPPRQFLRAGRACLEATAGSPPSNSGSRTPISAGSRSHAEDPKTRCRVPTSSNVLVVRSRNAEVTNPILEGRKP